MITPSFSLTATERVLPKLALDFTTGSLDSRVTFTRTTDATHPATYTNSSGVVTAATNNQARFDYNPTTLACKGLLIEESRTNSFLYSSDASQTAWIKTNLNVSTDSTTSPDGTSNADTIIETTTASVVHQYRQTTLGVPINGTYAFSIYVKAAGRTRILMSNEGGSNGGGYCYFDLSTVSTVSTGTWGNGVLVNYSITDVGNGWRRCIVTSTLPTDINRVAYITLVNSGTNTTYTGDGTSGVYVWGGQQESGAFATSYIPTTTTALTRNADVATMTGTNFSSWYNSSQGTFVFSGTTQNTTATCPIFSVNDGSLTNYITGAKQSTNKDLFYASGGVYLTNNVSYAYGSIMKGAYAYKANNWGQSTNAQAVIQDTTHGVPTVSRMEIGGFVSGSYPTNFWNQCIQKLFYYPQRLTNAELQAFSK
jgi:hypothetical protein